MIIGGSGLRRTPNLAARFADEFNLFDSLEATPPVFDRVRRACADVGRDRELLYSVAQTVCCGRDAAEIKRRADAIGDDLEGLRAEGLAGTPAEIVDKIGRFAELGCSAVYLQVLDLDDLEHLELLASEVMPQV